MTSQLIFRLIMSFPSGLPPLTAAAWAPALNGGAAHFPGHGNCPGNAFCCKGPSGCAGPQSCFPTVETADSGSLKQVRDIPCAQKKRRSIELNAIMLNTAIDFDLTN